MTETTSPASSSEVHDLDIETATDEEYGAPIVLSLGIEAPEAWMDATSEQQADGQLTEDACVIGEPGDLHCFLRSAIALPLPALDGEEFVWGVWVELTPEDLQLVQETWESEERAELPAIEGTLATDLPYEEDTVGLKVTLAQREPGLIPVATIVGHDDHPLATQQREGASVEWLIELNETMDVNWDDVDEDAERVELDLAPEASGESTDAKN